MILFAHQIPLDFVYSAVRNSMRFGEKQICVHSWLINKCQFMLLQRVLPPFIKQICALVYADECGSALALFVYWWK
jgi:hypothetical protein